MTMSTLMFPLNHQLQIITFMMMFFPMAIPVFDYIFLDVFDCVLRGGIVVVGGIADFSNLSCVGPEYVLFFFRDPALD